MYQNSSHRLINSRGFTLVELMIVIAIIGILAAALFPNLGNYFDRARRTEAKTEMRQISQLVLDAQLVSGKSLRYITNHACTECDCRPTAPHNYTGTLQEVPDAHACFINWKDAITHITLAGGSVSTGFLLKLYRDPWNAPYLLDENEAEHGACDYLRSSFGVSQLYNPGIHTIKLQKYSGEACP